MDKLITHIFSTELPNGEIESINAVNLGSAYSELSKKHPGINISDIYQEDSKSPDPSDYNLRQESSIIRQHAITASPVRVIINETTSKRQAYQKFLEQGYQINPGDVYQWDSQLPHSDDQQFDLEHNLSSGNVAE